MFICERCQHALNVHNPCNAMVGKGAKEHLCGCPQFLPEDLAARVATLTDRLDKPDPAELAESLAIAMKGLR